MSSQDESQRAAAPTAPPPALPPPHNEPQHSQAAAPYPPRHAQHPHYPPPPPGHPQGYPPQQSWHYPPPPSHPYHQVMPQPPSTDSTASKSAPSNPKKSESNNPKPTKSPKNTPVIIHKAKPPTPPAKTEPPEELKEPKVDPMKQDFHFYASDNFSSVLSDCKNKLIKSSLLTPENELYLTTTLLNATLINNWESAAQSTRTHYLKLEEGDRKRFMSEDEVASRHCATLTARKKSPKQNVAGVSRVEGVGKVRSFGLGEVVPQMVGVLGDGGEGGKRKRSG